MIALDTSGLLAALDPGQSSHTRAKAALEAAVPPLLLSPFILAELEYLIGKHVSPKAAQSLLDEVAHGAYYLVAFDNEAIQGSLELIQRYADMNIGLADASVWYLAVRYRSRDILTLDERHFRAFTDFSGRPFRLLPVDAI